MGSHQQIEIAKKFLKQRLKTDHTTFFGHSGEFNQIKELITRTVEHSESNSVLIIGPPSCGKTTLITSVLSKLVTDEQFQSNTLIVNLNGFVQTDDSFALKSITKQLRLETAVNGKLFTNFAENLAFLLDCLRSGERMKSKSVIFILEEFDLFCEHTNQTLIYNLFDISQSPQTPICVIGSTRRYDVIELLEKRVKSRFSHRQVFLFNDSDRTKDDQFLSNTFYELLKLPQVEEMDRSSYLTEKEMLSQSSLPLLRADFNMSAYAKLFKKPFITKWNKETKTLLTNKKVNATFQALKDYNVSVANLKVLVYRIVASIDEEDEELKTVVAKLPHAIHRTITEQYLEYDDKIGLMCDLSILEFSLIIAIKHHSDIYDREPFNFEIILNRLHKYQNSVQTTKDRYDRAVVLKAFDVLLYSGLITPVNVGSSAKELKEYKMFKLLLQNQQINKAVAQYKNLPTHIHQWAQSCQI